MNLSRCVACDLPVLELEGQFTKLDSFFIQQGAPPPETAGWWHARCLAGSAAAPAWYAARLRSYRDMRRFEPIAEPAGWTVLRSPQRDKVLALAQSGELLELSAYPRKQGRAVDGGVIVPHVDEEFHLELEDAAIIDTIKVELAASGTYPLSAVLAALGIADRVVHPEALERGAFHRVRSLEEHWGPHAVSARVEYGVFIPAEVAPFLGGAA
ncbi:MAG TPA: hypothetical protein VNO30_36840 [Kofleriaceae bacterium]|nr:hypothetical protein [Kofleriaceae bacterium]